MLLLFKRKKEDWKANTQLIAEQYAQIRAKENNVMNCLSLPTPCGKCSGNIVPVTLWLTNEKDLLVTGMCPNCEIVSSVCFPLTVLYKSCPKSSPEEPELPPEQPGQTPNGKTPDGEPFTAEDLSVLRAFGILSAKKEDTAG